MGRSRSGGGGGKAGAEIEVAVLQDFVKDRLRSSRVPELIQVWKELPYNESGKLLRRVVRTELGKARTDLMYCIDQAESQCVFAYQWIRRLTQALR